MKRKNRIKSLIISFLIMLTLCVSVSGTIAWIVTQSNEKKNVFIPGEINTEIDEVFENNVKESIVIKNKGTIPVYVRVAVVANWYDEAGAIVAPWNGSISLGSGWVQIGGYYYYTSPVPAGESTTNLLNVNKPISATPVNGTHLEMTVLHQSIQAEPVTVVSNEWGVTINGTTIVSNSTN